MNLGGVALAILGVWVLAQVTKGDALNRLGILPGSGSGSSA